MIEGASAAAAMGGPSATPWPRVAISDVARTSSGTTPSRRRAERYFAGGTVPWVKTLDLRNGEISATDECVTDLAVQETSLQVYPPGTVLVAMYGGFNQIGRTGLLRIPACVNQALSAIQVNRSRVVPEYLLAVLNLRVEDWKAVASSSRKDPNITGNDVRAFELPLPSMEEQRLIAAALSDVDDLLSKLDRLIAKKRDLKQAAMQQLLTGRVRMSGFSGEWQPTRLGDLANLTMGRTPSRRVQAYWGSEYMWASIADMQTKVLSETAEQITEAGASGVPIIPAGTLLMSFKLSIGRLAFAGCDLFTNEAICAFRKLKANASFLYYALQRVDFSQYGKQAVKGYTLNKQSLNAVEIFLPEVREQQAIAEVLSDLDAEIDALEARRDKTRQLKQGMMQALLTGRIRLV